MRKAFCTIITKRYLPAARALFKSIAATHGDVPFYVFLADRSDGCFDPAAEPFKVIPLDALGDAATLHRMTFYYNAFELCNAIKARAHTYMQMQTDADAWVYLDGDVMVTSSFAPVWELLERHSILLCPHLLRPAPASLIEPNETGLIRQGFYNGGFLGLRRGDACTQFLEWFTARLDRFCTAELTHDQRWLSIVPGFFADWAPALLPGLDVAYWNLHERPLNLQSNGAITAAGEPLLFFHFSAWDPANPQVISRRGVLPDVQANPAWKKLSSEYLALLKSSGLDDAAKWPYSFDKTPDGRTIDYRTRRQYYLDYFAGLFQNDDPFTIEPELRRRARRTTRKRFLQQVAAQLPPSLQKWIS